MLCFVVGPAKCNCSYLHSFAVNINSMSSVSSMCFNGMDFSKWMWTSITLLPSLKYSLSTSADAFNWPQYFSVFWLLNLNRTKSVHSPRPFLRRFSRRIDTKRPRLRFCSGAVDATTRNLHSSYRLKFDEFHDKCMTAADCTPSLRCTSFLWPISLWKLPNILSLFGHRSLNKPRKAKRNCVFKSN